MIKAAAIIVIVIVAACLVLGVSAVIMSGQISRGEEDRSTNAP